MTACELADDAPASSDLLLYTRQPITDKTRWPSSEHTANQHQSPITQFTDLASPHKVILHINAILINYTRKQEAQPIILHRTYSVTATVQTVFRTYSVTATLQTV